MSRILAGVFTLIQLLLVVLLVPVAILAVGAPIVLFIRLLLEIAQRIVG